MVEKGDAKDKPAVEHRSKTYQQVLDEIYKDQCELVRVFLQCLDYVVGRGYMKPENEFDGYKMSHFLMLSNEIRMQYSYYQSKQLYHKNTARIALNATLRRYAHVFSSFIQFCQFHFSVFPDPDKQMKKNLEFEDVLNADKTYGS